MLQIKSYFNQYRNRLGKTIALAKRMYYKTIFEQYKHNMKKKHGPFYQTYYTEKQLILYQIQ